MTHPHAPLLDDTRFGNETWLDPGELDVVELWTRSLRPLRPSPSVWQRLLRSIDEDARE